MQQYANLAIPTYRTKTVLEKLEEVSAIVKYIHEMKVHFSPEPALKAPVIYSTPDPFVDKIFTRNLETIKVLSENLSSFSLFVPQVLNYQRINTKEGSFKWSPHIDNKALQKLMERLNTLMQGVCPGDNEPGCVFVDEVLQVQWGTKDFIDNGHFSPQGGEKFAEIISRIILAQSQDGSTNSYVH